ncbi:MAG: alpha/beta hydrolase [Bacilli bacterium]|nr:alpha/beta hydrolase [Bacilli bacterium]
MEYFYIIVIVIAILILITSIFLLISVVHPRRYTLEKSKIREQEREALGDYEKLYKENYVVESYDGYFLNVTYIPNNSKKFVIISHGHTYTRYGSIKYLHIFRHLGYNVIIYDNRGHGANKKVAITMGYKESRDLIEIINDTYYRYGEDIYLGLHGESMGSAITNMALKYHPKIAFIVSDCGYSDLMILLASLARTKFHFPTFIIDISSLFCKILYGFSFWEIRPIQELRTNNIPICFIHGANDKFIDYSHSQNMYQTNPGYKEIHIISGAGHAKSWDVDKEGYQKIITNFLENIAK